MLEGYQEDHCMFMKDCMTCVVESHSLSARFELAKSYNGGTKLRLCSRRTHIQGVVNLRFLAAATRCV